MENITKTWAKLRAKKASSIALVALFALLLLIPWPSGAPVRVLLRMHAPETLAMLSWKDAYLQPSGGLLFTELELKPASGVRMHAPSAHVRFSWSRLLMLETRIVGIEADTLSVDWALPANSADADLAYAAPTESHLEQVKPLLDSLAKLIAPSGTGLNIKHLILHLGADTLELADARVDLDHGDKRWELRLETGKARIRSWPLPDKLDAKLEFKDTASALKSLSACWQSGCMTGSGSFGRGRSNSSLTLELDAVPLHPFGAFALPKDAAWNGKASGDVEWEGRIAHPATWKAHGALKLADVAFSKWPFQREGTFAGFVPELAKDLELDQVSIPRFRLEASRIHLDSMDVHSKELKALVRGSWTFPERLDFRITGSMSKDLYERLPRLTRLALPKTEDGGGAFKATLSGTFTWQALSPDSEHFGTVLQNLFR